MVTFLKGRRRNDDAVVAVDSTGTNVTAALEKLVARAEAAVEQLVRSHAAIPDGAPVRLAKRTSNLFRARAASDTAYAAEAGQFQEAGFSTVICGPGSIDQAHQPDEYITLDQLAAGEAFMRRLIAEMRG